MDQTLAERIAAAARAMEREKTPGLTMDKAVEVSRDIVGNADDCSITLVHRKKTLETPAATSDAARLIERLQYELGEGPCVEAVFHTDVVRVADLEDDRRWLSWGRRVVEETGVRSAMCLRMFTADDTLGALNFYSRRAGAFDDDDQEHAVAMAAHASLAVAAAVELEQVWGGLDSRLVIGQAQGILMHQFDIDVDQAFQVLVRASSETNIKLRLVAEELVRTRRLPLRGS